MLFSEFIIFSCVAVFFLWPLYYFGVLLLIFYMFRVCFLLVVTIIIYQQVLLFLMFKLILTKMVTAFVVIITTPWIIYRYFFNLVFFSWKFGLITEITQSYDFLSFLLFLWCSFYTSILKLQLIMKLLEVAVNIKFLHLLHWYLWEYSVIENPTNHNLFFNFEA